jgi:hypothetical protein
MQDRTHAPRTRHLALAHSRTDAPRTCHLALTHSRTDAPRTHALRAYTLITIATSASSAAGARARVSQETAKKTRMESTSERPLTVTPAGKL